MAYIVMAHVVMAYVVMVYVVMAVRNAYTGRMPLMNLLQESK